MDVFPPDGATGVSPSVIPTYTFSDFPDPNTVNGGKLSLNTGPFYFSAVESVDLVNRRVRFQTTSRLPVGVGFTLVVVPGLQSLRGCQMAPPPVTADGRRPSLYTFSFRTVEPGQPIPPPDPVPPPATFDQVLGVFAAHCAGGGCHLNALADPADPVAACSDAAAGNLSLCGRDAYDGLVGVTSQQVSRLVRVAPRDSARSYLLRKLLGAPPFVGHTNPPPDTLSQDDLTTIASWIDAAAVRAPPPP